MKDLLYYLIRYAYLLPNLMVANLFVVNCIETFTSYRFSQNSLTNLGLYFGVSWSTILISVAYFFNPKHKYCSFTRWNVVGLLINVILFEIGRFISNDLYQKFYTIIVFGIVYIGWLLYYYRNKK